MLTFKDHPPIVDTDKKIIQIWNDEKNDYESHSFEFVFDLCEYINLATML